MVDQDIIKEFKEKVLEIFLEWCEKIKSELPQISGESQEVKKYEFS